MKGKHYRDVKRIEALCQDCLAVNPSHHFNNGKCHCGGETCHCRECHRVLRLLRKGCLDWKKLGLQKPIDRWTQENGIFIPPEPPFETQGELFPELFI